MIIPTVRQTLRRFELVYRVGGEEFLILLPGMAEWEAESVADRLRLAIDRLEPQTGATITASFGVSAAAGQDIDFERLYRRADEALYQAKGAGRDRVNVSAAAPVGSGSLAQVD